MPELPEVETVMRALRVRLEGRRILKADINRADLRWPIPPTLAHELEGARVTSFRRRGKYILMRLDAGRTVLIHLGMSGRMNITRDAAPAPLHEHAVLYAEDGWRIALVDPRRFGALDLLRTDQEDQHRLIAPLGPEPLEPSFTATILARALENRRTPLKAALLDQRLVAGLGNIYVCEALFRARLSPLRLAGDAAGRTRATRLVAAIKQTLTDAIAAGGSSLRDYVQPDGELGFFQHEWKVYGRQGQPCERCPGPAECNGIARLVQSGRSSFVCLDTQL